MAHVTNGGTMFSNGKIPDEMKTQLEAKQFEKVMDALEFLQEKIHQNGKDKGFWPELEDYLGVEWTEETRVLEVAQRVNIGERIALAHSELSEALEAARKDILTADKHCPEHLNFFIELADTVIRCFDTAGAFHYDLGAAIIAKMKFNKSRPYKHGKKF